MELNLSPLNIVIVMVVLYLIYTFVLCDGNEKFDYKEPKFPPKEFVSVKRPCKYSESEKQQMEMQRIRDSQVERNIGEWSHRGEHNSRHTGYSPKYHGEKTVQFMPSWPNTTDDFEVIHNMPKENLADENDYPVLDISDKVDVDDILY
jgi:hypothetical protein